MGAGSIEYVVSMKGGYHPLYEGMEVLVEVVKSGTKYERPRVSAGKGLWWLIDPF